MVSAGIRDGTRPSPTQSPSDLIRRASEWTAGEEPRARSLPELEDAAGIRWVDIQHTRLRSAQSLGILNRVCDGALTQRMARDLATPRRFPAAGVYDATAVRMTAAFLVRHLQLDLPAADPAGPVASILKPVQLLVGPGWLLSAWLPSRLFRGSSAALEADCDGHDPDRLHLAVASSWPDSEGETADDLAELIRRELEVASGHRTRAV
jgi:hypothetical protein